MHNLFKIVFFVLGNPLFDSMDETIWRAECMKKLPKLMILDGIPLIRD